MSVVLERIWGKMRKPKQDQKGPSPSAENTAMESRSARLDSDEAAQESLSMRQRDDKNEPASLGTTRISHTLESEETKPSDSDKSKRISLPDLVDEMDTTLRKVSDSASFRSSTLRFALARKSRQLALEEISKRCSTYQNQLLELSGQKAPTDNATQTTGLLTNVRQLSIDCSRTITQIDLGYFMKLMGLSLGIALALLLLESFWAALIKQAPEPSLGVFPYVQILSMAGLSVFPVLLGVVGTLFYLLTTLLRRHDENPSVPRSEITAELIGFAIRINISVAAAIGFSILSTYGIITSQTLPILCLASGFSAKLVNDFFNKIVEKGSKIINAL